MPTGADSVTASWRGVELESAVRLPPAFGLHKHARALDAAMEPSLDPPLVPLAAAAPGLEEPCFACRRPQCARCKLSYCGVDCCNRGYLLHERTCRRRGAADASAAAAASDCPVCDEPLRACAMCGLLGRS